MFEEIKHSTRFLMELVEEIEKSGTAKPVEDTFYETFNGSYVFIHEFHESPISDALPDALRELLMESPIGALLQGNNGNTNRYMALVLKGGHSMRPSGGKPGDAYAVDTDGGYFMDGKDCLHNPLVVGMSLKRLVGHINFLDTIKKN